ncbi:MAG: hypothetical protein JSV77_06335 [Dehalococcoidales bacterium]|nr:MAG: hypothetical protein JSV77_06335 [Dehalococcoidales bacterium]
MKKKKISRILGVSLTLALLSSLLVGVVPASAAVSSATVSADDYQISAPATYDLVFSIATALPVTGDIIIDFPAGFDISGILAAADDDLDTVVTNDPDDDVNVAGTSGIGTTAFALTSCTSTVSGAVGTGMTLTIDVPQAIGVGATLQVIIGDSGAVGGGGEVLNSGVPGDYVLEISTSSEPVPAVDSQTFTLIPPVVPPAPGIVTLHNDADIPMAIYTGLSAIQDAINAASNDWLLDIGAGTYVENPDTIGLTGMRFQAQVPGTAIVRGTWDIDATGALLTGLNIEGTVAIAATGDGADIVDCWFEYDSLGTADLLTVANGATGVDVSGCTFDVSASLATNGINTMDALDVDGCNFTVGASNFGIASNPGAPPQILDVADSTFTGAGSGLDLNAGSDTLVGGSGFDGMLTGISMSGDTLDVQDSTFTGCGASGATAALRHGALDILSVGDAQGVVIYDNTFSGNVNGLLKVSADAEHAFFKFNTCDLAAGFDNDDTATLDATNNWYGSADGPVGLVNDPPVNVDPWLPYPLTGAVVQTGIAAGLANEVNASGTVGVEIWSTGTMDCVGLGNYADNPVPGQPFLADVIRWFEINVVGLGGITDDVTITLHGITNVGAAAWAWSTYMDMWVQVVAVVDLFTGTVSFTLDNTTSPSNANLNELVFALTEPAVAPLGLPALPISPVLGADDVDIDPSFTWGAVAGATGYEFQIAVESSVPGVDPYIVPFDSKNVATTGCRLIEDLAYDTTYVWRVRAVRNGDVGPWLNSFITTMVEPEEPEPPIEIIQQDPPIINIPDWPDTIVEETTPVIPDYLLWVVIGVAAVLVIAVIVLIVRTRRVA